VFKGPPNACPYCGGHLVKGRKGQDSVGACLVIVIGVLLIPLLIGILILLYGLHLGSKAEGIWRCVNCGAEFPRTLRWYEYG